MIAFTTMLISENDAVHATPKNPHEPEHEVFGESKGCVEQAVERGAEWVLEIESKPQDEVSDLLRDDRVEQVVQRCVEEVDHGRPKSHSPCH